MQDFLLGLRTLAHRRRTSLLALAVLTLGLGFSTAMWSVLDGVLLRGLPFPDGDKIVIVTTARGYNWPMPAADFHEVRERQRVFSEMAAFRSFNSVVTREDAGSKGLTATYVTGGLFRLLGVEPVLGRNFTPADEDPSSPAVAMISYRVWQTLFGGDPQIAGRTLILDREPMTLVGVMPEGFHFPVRQEAWAVPRWQEGSWSEASAYVIGRLRPGWSVSGAERELAALVAQLEDEQPGDEARQAHVRRYVDAILPLPIQRALRLMLWAVLGVLLIACVNAAGLRLGDALAREHELMVRRALGARTGSLLRLLMAEAAMLVAASTAAALAVAWALVRVVSLEFLQGSMLVRQFWIDVRLDSRSVLFAAGMAAVAVLIGGLVPALWSLRRGTLQVARRSTDGPGALRLAKTLVAAEVAICFALVCGSGLLVRSGLSLLSQEPAFDPENLMRVLVTTHQAELETPQARRAFWDKLLPRLVAAPEIADATLARGVPWLGALRKAVRVDPRLDPSVTDLPRAEVFEVLPGFFAALRLPLQSGRSLERADLTARDGGVPLPVVVSTSFAERHLEGPPLGRSFELLPTRVGGEPVSATVVGVVADLGLGRRDEPFSEDAVYTPLSFAEGGGGYLLVRGRGDAAGLIGRIDREIARVDPLVATLDERAYREERAEQLWVERRLAELFSLFALTSLILSAAGLFGVMTLSLHRRGKELAIRSALGALPHDLRTLLLGDGARCVVPGLLAGAGLVWLTHSFVRGFLYEIEPWDPVVTAGAAIGVAAVLLVSVLGPVRRAARADAAGTLKSE